MKGQKTATGKGGSAYEKERKVVQRYNNKEGQSDNHFEVMGPSLCLSVRVCWCASHRHR